MNDQIWRVPGQKFTDPQLRTSNLGEKTEELLGLRYGLLYNI